MRPGHRHMEITDIRPYLTAPFGSSFQRERLSGYLRGAAGLARRLLKAGNRPGAIGLG